MASTRQDSLLLRRRAHTPRRQLHVQAARPDAPRHAHLPGERPDHVRLLHRGRPSAALALPAHQSPLVLVLGRPGHRLLHRTRHRPAHVPALLGAVHSPGHARRLRVQLAGVSRAAVSRPDPVSERDYGDSDGDGDQQRRDGSLAPLGRLVGLHVLDHGQGEDRVVHVGRRHGDRRAAAVLYGSRLNALQQRGGRRRARRVRGAPARRTRPDAAVGLHGPHAPRRLQGDQARRLPRHPHLRLHTQSALRPGRHHVRPLPRALRHVLRRHAHRQGDHQDAHTEDIRHLLVQSAPLEQGVRARRHAALRGRQARATARGVAQQGEVQAAQRRRQQPAGRRAAGREHRLVGTRQGGHAHDTLLCRVDHQLAGPATLQAPQDRVGRPEKSQLEEEEDGGKTPTLVCVCVAVVIRSIHLYFDALRHHTIK